MMTLNHRLEVLLGISLLLSFFTWGRKILFPFQIFTTWVHECCHALISAILGGDSITIAISPDGSGLTHFKIPKGKIRHGIIASAGYLGSSLIGCLIFILAVSAEKSPQYWNIHSMVILLSALIGLSLLFWVRNVFGFISLFLLALAIASLNYSPLNHYAHEIILFLAIQTALNALFDIRTLFSITPSKGKMSDAHTLEKLFYLPHWFWAICWLSLSHFMMFWTIKVMF